MSGYGPVERSSATSVRLSLPVGLGPPTRNLMNSSRPVDNASGRRLTAWIVRSIILATTAFALLDLSLLVSSIHH
jgi:hypothetical protein